MGCCYLKRFILMCDYFIQITRLRKGRSVAYSQLGWLCEQSCLSMAEKWKKRAVAFYRIAVRRRESAGMNNLASCYAQGYGCRKNISFAIHWYKEAVSNGNVAACHNLGLCYYNGEGVEGDLGKSVSLIRLAAHHQFPMAWFYLGLFYYCGEGVSRSPLRAFYCFRKAADMGVANAQYEVAIWYKEREVSLKDHMCYLFWLIRAAANGSDYAAKIISKKINIFNGVSFFSSKRAFFFLSASISMILCLWVILTRMERCLKHSVPSNTFGCNSSAARCANMANAHGRSVRIGKGETGGASRSLQAARAEIPEDSIRQLAAKPADGVCLLHDLAQAASDKNQVMDELLNQDQIPVDYGTQMVALFRDKGQDVLTRDFAVQHIGLYAQALNRRGVYDSASAEARTLRAALDEASTDTKTIIAAAAFRALADMAAFDPLVDTRRLDARLAACAGDASAAPAARVMAAHLCGERRVSSARATLSSLAASSSTPTPLRLAARHALGSFTNGGAQ